MTELRKRARCRSEILLKYVAINRKGEHNKTCETCLNKIRKTKPVSTVPLKRTDTDFVDDNVSTTTPDTSEEEEPMHKQYIIVRDCETNGLINSRALQPSANNLTMFPRIVQLRWGLYTENGECK